MIGASSENEKGWASGAAYVFKRTGASWVQEAKLTASDAAVGDYFGSSVSVNGDTVVIGALGKGTYVGAAYVFKRTGVSWVQEAELTASDAAANDLFGGTVSINGDSVVIGAYGNDDNGSSSGAAYVFKRTGVSWVQEAKLTASDAAASDLFGYFVSINGDSVVISAIGEGSNAGAAYVFKRTGANWLQEAKLTASDAAVGDYFGGSVAIDGDSAVIGASVKSNSIGAAYVFKHTGASWSQEAKLTASDAAASDQFGYYVAISGTNLIAGAFGVDDNGADSGAAYFFNNSLSNTDTTPPVISGISMSSNNANSSYAKSGDVITMVFTSDEPINTPTVTIAGQSATVSNNGNDWLATITVAANSTEGSANFTISNISDVTNNTATDIQGTPATTVIIDVNAPVMSFANPPFISNIDEGETLLNKFVSENGVTWGVIGNDLSIDSSGQVSLDSGAVLGTVYTFQVTATDAAGNISTTNQVSVTVNDITPPIVTGISMTSDNANSSYAKSGDVITMVFTSDEPINTPTVTIAGQSATVSNNGNDWSATITVAFNSTEGDSSFVISDISDVANNTATDIQGTPATTVIIDVTAPVAIAQDLVLPSDVNGAATITAAQVDNGSSDANGVTLSINHENYSCNGPSIIGTLTATDPAGNSATEFYNVTLTDNIAPVITLIGSSDPVFEVGGFFFSNFTASATDNCGIFANFSGVGAVDINTVGDYPIVYNISDSAGNPAVEVIRTVHVVDTTIPVITLLGAAIVTIEVGTTYVDAGVTAIDNYDDPITVINIVSTVDNQTVGDYTVTYNITDSNSNAADTVIRTVHVVDTTLPVITLLGDNPQILEVEDAYIELGATATDNYDDNTTITNSIIIDDTNVVAGTLGTYTVTYNVTDVNTNAAIEVTRTVKVVDTTIPVIALIGANPQIIDVNTAYVELGATALDNYDGDITGSIVVNTSVVDLSTVNCYPVSYNVSDISGNHAIQKTRYVFVLEHGKPFAKNDAVSVTENSENNIFTIIGNDSYGLDGPHANHPISLSGTYTDYGGKVDLVGNTLKYTPKVNFIGVDKINYIITDLNGDASRAEVTITVTEMATPKAIADAVSVLENSVATAINVLENDNFGANGPATTGSLTLSSGFSAEGGIIVVNDGKVEYTPAKDFSGEDTFVYMIKDGGDNTTTATVTVTVDDAVVLIVKPAAYADAVTVNQNSTDNEINVLAENGSKADTFGSKGALMED